MDLSTRSRLGISADAKEAVVAKEESAIVFLTEERAEIWVLADESASDGHAAAPVSVERNPGESGEQAALRIAEHLRGRLLPGRQRADDDEARAGESSFEGLGRDVVFSVSSGPLLVVRSDASPALAWSLDSAFWFGRFGIGAFIRTSLTQSDWRLKPKNFTMREIVGGVAARLVLFQMTPRWQTQLILRAGWNASALRSKGEKMPEQRKEGTLGFLMSEAGLESSYAVTSWLSLGGQALGGFDAHVSWSPHNAEPPTEPAPPPPPDAGLQGHLVLGAVATARF